MTRPPEREGVGGWGVSSKHEGERGGWLGQLERQRSSFYISHPDAPCTAGGRKRREEEEGGGEVGGGLCSILFCSREKH